MSDVKICPVCAGKGQIPCGFYQDSPLTTGSAMSESCRACYGRGIIIIQCEQITDRSPEFQMNMSTALDATCLKNKAGTRKIVNGGYVWN